ncbi:MAG: glycosyltransferase family 39 protein [Chloroflexi bacterium]|nr:glycosyltransferase family 39 protein [Chloroflexota bacterium]
MALNRDHRGGNSRSFSVSTRRRTILDRWWLPAAILLVAFAVRVFWLGNQSLWTDEGYSWAHTNGSLRDVFERVRIATSQAPFYFLLLWGWRHVFDATEIGLRSLSVVTGTLAVWLTWLVADRILGRRGALWAGLLSALSPLWVYYAQDARPYALSSALAAGTFLFALEAFQKRSIRFGWAFGYALVAAASVWTHYLAAFGVLATVLVVHRARRHLLVWGAATFLSALPTIGWVAFSWNEFFYTATSDAPRGLPLASYLSGVAEAFANGLPSPTGLPTTTMVLGLGVAFVGLAVRRSWSIAGWLALVLIGVELVGFPSDHPGPWVRYVLVALPAFILLQAAGVEFLWTKRAAFGAISLLSIVVVSAVSLWHVYADPTLARADFRGPVRWLAANVTTADRVLVNVAVPPFFYYYGDARPSPVVLAPVADIESLRNPADVLYFVKSQWAANKPTSETQNDSIRRLRSQLEEATEGAQRVYLLKYMPPDYDPDGQIESWLEAHGTKTSDEWIENIRLVSYAFGAGVKFDDPGVSRVGARVGDQIELLGWSLSSPLRAGAPTEVTLFWRATGPISTSYKVFVHVVAAGDPERKVAQHDSMPGLDTAPTSQWKPGEVVTDGHSLVMPAGEWQLAVGMYNPDDGVRPTVRIAGKPDDNRILLGPFTVE